jgi:hypothetical protein
MTGHLSIEDKEHSGRPTEVTFPENMDVILSMIWDDPRISAKKITETMAISLEWTHVTAPDCLNTIRLAFLEPTQALTPFVPCLWPHYQGNVEEVELQRQNRLSKGRRSDWDGFGQEATAMQSAGKRKMATNRGRNM